MRWGNVEGITSKKYMCGYCGSIVASAIGYLTQDSPNGHQAYIYVCPHCERPTFMHINHQIPGISPGNEVGNLPEDIAALYKEACQSVSVNSYTASVLACRKLLMNIAVNHGAKEGATFVSYIEHLANAGFVPPNGLGWVDHIRSKGNEATHEIRLMNKDEAIELISFPRCYSNLSMNFQVKSLSHNQLNLKHVGWGESGL